jgi:serine acetyltransferase
MISEIGQDWDANRGNPRSQLVMALFRLVGASPGPLRPVAAALYQAVVVWGLGIELNHKAAVGAGLRIFHGVGLVVHESARIGAHCTLRQCTTLGERNGGCPVLCDGVDVGANAVILGPVTIGAGAAIGAGAVVLVDVPPGAAAVGNPARVIEGKAGDPRG